MGRRVVHVGPRAPGRRGAAEFQRQADPSRPWFANKMWGAFLMVLYPVLVATPLLTFAALNRISDHLRSAELGVDCAVIGFSILALQFVITARLRWVEAPFGLDVLLGFHRAMALVAMALLCVHPVLVAREEGWSLITGMHVHWFVWVGRLTFAVLVSQVVVSLSRRVVRLSYDRWRRLHNPTALGTLALGFVHSVGAGDDMHGGSLLVWCGVMALALGFWVYRHVVRPRLLRRHPFRVVEVKPEASRVWTLTLEPDRGRPFHFAPGQFQFLRLNSAAVPSEEHPFTIASSPARGDQISLTIKESGDFTAGISRVRPGDRATVDGPFGRFSHTLHPKDADLVFVAGGVGITPLMSMLRYMRDRSEPRRVQLVYACRGVADVMFTSELEAMQADGHPALRVIYVLEDAPSAWPGETGRLDADRIAKLCEEIERKTFYLCCPPLMMRALIRGLRRMGVRPDRIHADYFSF